MYFGQRLVIVGGKNSAIEAAIRCQRAGAHVTLCYRGGRLRSVAREVLAAAGGALDVARPPRAGDSFRDADRDPRAVDRVADASRHRRRAADFVLSLTGYEQDTSLFEMAGINVKGKDQNPAYDEATMESNVPGIFIAGTAIAGSPVWSRADHRRGLPRARAADRRGNQRSNGHVTRLPCSDDLVALPGQSHGGGAQAIGRDLRLERDLEPPPTFSVREMVWPGCRSRSTVPMTLRIPASLTVALAWYGIVRPE